jgi:hypothetical protein
MLSVPARVLACYIQFASEEISRSITWQMKDAWIRQS